MKNFNWEAFKRGDIAVHCNTEEKAKDFLKKCDKEGIRWQRGQYTHEFTKWDIFKERTSYSFFINGIAITRLDLDKTQGYKIIEWEIDTMKELKSLEVIANIEEGQAYKCTRKNARVKAIKRKIIDNKDVIEFLVDGKCGYSSFAIEVDDTFTLHRKEYTFQEAFKAYEEGEEIESVSSGCRYKKEKGKGKDTYMYLADWMEFDSIELEEIRGKWYIND